MDLIFAEATPPGRGGVSVIRLSGDGARAAAERLVGPLERPRHAYFRDLAQDGDLIDQVLALWFAQGSSFTGEEVAELHLHGAPVIARRVARALIEMGARPAEAGEFTRRAFLNGRIDLAEIEGLGDLLAAETEAQRKLALRSVSGELARRAEEWRALLIEAGALVEVSVDFADEDVPDDVPDRVFEAVAELRVRIQKEIDGFQAAERIREGFEVAIIGPPNAGKSSLLNRLARREMAIVSEVAGTTRDVIELRFDLKGLAVTFLDTAGLREAGDAVEAVGVERARGRARDADLRIHLSRDAQAVTDLWMPGDLTVRSHADDGLLSAGLSVSSLTGAGIDEMLADIQLELSGRIAGAGIVSHDRQRAELVGAITAFDGLEGLPPELVAESLRVAASCLDRLVGRIGADDYLDAIFSSFCIGK
ncbi:tRNA uridine-5-carboxymethylaminomethyl(34) synthesis GTPase MnmE [Paracoccus liaowanqingii]|uniref:tRNA modification GTPase MnmE n=1 Tax=Paracoccus liaowanqingii TaxID=2560053 RepID=A0A4Z1CT39_9RHOB|nr:tRNA uridine-5-carboxymethylaminomethyl(34) synthesis GTPase MnmE [Paracoccus liaowanqingii]TGN68688.1 tRNA uridine-5-carboxymethylaminomethyl(34) synthesis GTPase MnmE [Paracoccus liaowanqingii]